MKDLSTLSQLLKTTEQEIGHGARVSALYHRVFDNTDDGLDILIKFPNGREHLYTLRQEVLDDTDAELIFHRIAANSNASYEDGERHVSIVRYEP